MRLTIEQKKEKEKLLLQEKKDMADNSSLTAQAINGVTIPLGILATVGTGFLASITGLLLPVIIAGSVTALSITDKIVGKITNFDNKIYGDFGGNVGESRDHFIEESVTTPPILFSLLTAAKMMFVYPFKKRSVIKYINNKYSSMKDIKTNNKVETNNKAETNNKVEINNKTNLTTDNANIFVKNNNDSEKDNELSM